MTIKPIRINPIKVSKLIHCLWAGVLCLVMLLVGPFQVGTAAVWADNLLDLPTILLDSSSSPLPVLDPGNIPSEKVSQFVHACLQVVKLIERREGELQAAETETESLRIEQEIEAEALAIIEKAGLTRQEYLQLLGLANTDPEFGERVAIQLQETSA
jgi:hypothetical protein